MLYRKENLGESNFNLTNKNRLLGDTWMLFESSSGSTASQTSKRTSPLLSVKLLEKFIKSINEVISIFKHVVYTKVYILINVFRLLFCKMKNDLFFILKNLKSYKLKTWFQWGVPVGSLDKSTGSVLPRWPKKIIKYLNTSIPPKSRGQKQEKVL